MLAVAHNASSTSNHDTSFKLKSYGSHTVKRQAEAEAWNNASSVNMGKQSRRSRLQVMMMLKLYPTSSTRQVLWTRKDRLWAHSWTAVWTVFTCSDCCELDQRAHFIPDSGFMTHFNPNSGFMAHFIPNSWFMALSIPNSWFMAHFIPNSWFMAHFIPNSGLEAWCQLLSKWSEVVLS